MRALVTCFVSLIALTGWLQARLGETLDQCVERYGPIVEKRPAEFPQSDPELAVFSKSAVTILVEFKDGKAWHVTFRKPLLTQTEIDTLVKANSGEGGWSPPLSVAGRTFRQSDDHTRLSVVNEPRAGTGASVEVMTREYIDQYRRSFL